MEHALHDNGSEFAGHFQAAVQAADIPQWHTFPKTPKMNARCERFNRTLQEEFIDYHEELLFTDRLAPLVQHRTPPSCPGIANTRPGCGITVNINTVQNVLAEYMVLKILWKHDKSKRIGVKIVEGGKGQQRQNTPAKKDKLCFM